jgi:hypothetical protein
MLREKFPAEWRFFTKLGPPVSLFPVLIFGVNSPIFPFCDTILGRRIRIQKLVFKTKSWQKVSKQVVTADCSYGISVSLVPQPQEKISNKTKCLPFLFKKEHPCIPRVVVHHNKDIPLPTR